jgi:hypothetical protein
MYAWRFSRFHVADTDLAAVQHVQDLQAHGMSQRPETNGEVIIF